MIIDIKTELEKLGDKEKAKVLQWLKNNKLGKLYEKSIRSYSNGDGCYYCQC